MPSPFPGMNPYFEQPTFWSSFHTRLIGAIDNALSSELRPHYYVEIKTRFYQDPEGNETGNEGEGEAGTSQAVFSAEMTSPVSDAGVQEMESATLPSKRPQSVILPIPLMMKERYLQVREVGSDAIVTAIEVLTPRTKQKGVGRMLYERKRGRVLRSSSHLIEIDLLRGYPPMSLLSQVQPTDYRVLVSRVEQRPQADLYGFNLSEPIPSFPLPLQPEDPDVTVDLQALVEGIYEQARYTDRIDYRQPVPSPSLSLAQQQWVNERLILLRGERGTN